MKRTEKIKSISFTIPYRKTKWMYRALVLTASDRPIWYRANTKEDLPSYIQDTLKGIEINGATYIEFNSDGTIKQ